MSIPRTKISPLEQAVVVLVKQDKEAGKQAAEEYASLRSALEKARSFAQLVLQPVIFNNPVLIQDAARNLLAALPNAGKE